MLMLDHLCDVSRSAAVGTNGRSALTALYTAVQCLVLPMNTHTAIENKFSIGRAYDIYFASGQDIKPGDQLVSNGRTFVVKVVQPFETRLVSDEKAAVKADKEAAAVAPASSVTPPVA